MKKLHKGPRPKTSATRQQVNKEPRRQTGAMSEEAEEKHERHRRVELRTPTRLGSRGSLEDPI
jgi:hypothetical protein